MTLEMREQLKKELAEVRLVACDIDGTLLLGGKTEIPPVIFEQIRALRKKGIRFATSSGRQYTSLKRLFGPVVDEIFFICENGSIVFGPGEQGEVIYKSTMSWELGQSIAKDILEREQCEVMFSGEDTCYLVPKNPDVVSLVRDFVGNNTTILKAPEDMPEAIMKVSAFCRDGVEGHIDYFHRWDDYSKVTIGTAHWVDISLTDKGHGAKPICDVLGITMDQVIAVGDNFNDEGILDKVGHPFIMENADPRLKKAYKRHCENVSELLDILLEIHGEETK